MNELGAIKAPADKSITHRALILAGLNRHSELASTLRYTEVRSLGVQADASGDDLHICGTDQPLSGRIETGGDHRIAMAFAVLGKAPRVQLKLSETLSPGVSYPNFHDDLQAVGVHV